MGKTSIAAAHGLAYSARYQAGGATTKKTLIISTDMAHNLADLFGKQFGPEPVPITEYLYALELDANYEMQAQSGHIMAAFQALLPSSDAAGGAESTENMVAFPGLEELFALLKIHELYKRGDYDLIIVDCAPTGETLSLLKFPELLSWYMEKLFPLEKAMLKILRPISKVAFQLELPDKKAVNEIERLYYKLFELQSLLKDASVCSIRICSLPEKMVVEETKRSYMYLNLFGYHVDALYINRVLPADADNSFFEQWKKSQAGYIRELEETFSHLPIYKIKWYETDINGLEGLQRIIEDSLGSEALFAVRPVKENEIYRKTEEGYTLSIYIPFLDKDRFELYESASDLNLKADNFKRNIPLPNVLVGSQIVSAKKQEDYLLITFRKQSAGKEKEDTQ